MGYLTSQVTGALASVNCCQFEIVSAALHQEPIPRALYDSYIKARGKHVVLGEIVGTDNLVAVPDWLRQT